MGYRLHKLAQYLRGWMGLLRLFASRRTTLPCLNSMGGCGVRIRMCYWKQWRRVRTKIRHLLALGTSKRQVILTALSRKAYWHLARTLATQTGMTNDWLAPQGLLSIRNLWLKAHGYA